MPCHLYLLFSEKLNKFYVGSTTELERRLLEHKVGKKKFTKTGIPWEMLYSEPFEDLINPKKGTGN